MKREVEVASFLHKKKKEEQGLFRAPKEFIDVVNLQTLIKKYPSRSDFLRDLAKEIRPSIKDLKKKGFLKDEEEEEHPLF